MAPPNHRWMVSWNVSWVRERSSTSPGSHTNPMLPPPCRLPLVRPTRPRSLVYVTAGTGTGPNAAAAPRRLPRTTSVSKLSVK